MKIKGDLRSNSIAIKNNFISCLVCSARGPHVLKDLLNDLSQQTLDQKCFEVIILDNSSCGSVELIDSYSDKISIKYIHQYYSVLMLGALRNQTVELSQGEYLLFLDDDTRIFDPSFLKQAIELFGNSNADVIMPLGNALESSEYLDPYSYAARCCLYKRSALENAGGFFNELAAYEDIDLGIRCFLMGVKVLRSNQLGYNHPKLFFKSLRKPVTIGQSIFKLREHYPWYLWLMIYFNALRFLPLGLIPTVRNRQWFMISLGVLIAPFFRKGYSYR